MRHQAVRPRSSFRFLLAGFCLALVIAVPGARAATVEVSGVAFDDYVLIADWNVPLRLAGATEVSRRYLPFHAVALYVTRGEIDGGALSKAMAPCRIEMHWLLPSLSAADAAQYWHERFDTLLPDAQTRARLKPVLDRVVAAFGEAKRGDVLILEYHPDRGLRVLRNGAVAGQFAGLELNRTILSSWVGTEAPSATRNALLGLKSIGASQ
jgi:Chalcone isomerase-like